MASPEIRVKLAFLSLKGLRKLNYKFSWNYLVCNTWPVLMWEIAETAIKNVGVEALAG